MSDTDSNRRDRHGQPSTSFTGDIDPDALAEALSDVARSLETESDLQSTLNAVVAAAVRTVPGSEHAGVTVVHGRRDLHTPAATAELVRAVDRVQFETSQGPCVDTIRLQKTLRANDLRTDERWPDFARRVVQLGVRSMLSFQLYVDGDNLGSLNLYSGRADAFTDESEYVGLLFASHAAVAMVGAQKALDMNRALAMRDLIGQAKGILMERHRITADQAFDLLVRASQRTNTRLAELARHLTETGEVSAPRPAGLQERSPSR